MTSIEAVIARSRMQGGFSERKRFTVARRRGIEKLRKFALSDPHHYVLEIVQAAIANGAEYVDLQIERDSATLSYIGGGLREHELAQLFDFLFASKDRSDIGHVRELALGLNAALLFKPDRIIVESGNGTLAGSTRMVVHSDHDEVEVGRPDKPMTGTFVSIQGMKRSALGGGWFSRFNADWPIECQVIEERCLAAPIPIVVGGRPLFGWASQRTPGLFGYKQVLAFDEGELYGALGLRPTFGNPDFRLLTWGVAIQSRSHILIPGHQLGGIVCFDRLHKTVDHSGIVDDARLAEMWERLRPYAMQLISGKKEGSPYGAALLGTAEALTPIQLRELLRPRKYVVVVDPNTVVESPQGRRALAIGAALSAPVLTVAPHQIRSLPALAGGELGVVQPYLEDDIDAEIYRSAPPEPPARPWLSAPIEVVPVSTATLAERMTTAAQATATERGRAHNFADALGAGDITATVYTPSQAVGSSRGLHVQLLSSERLVWQGSVPSAHSGYVLVVQLPNTPPSLLRHTIDDAPGAPSVAEEVARAVVEYAAQALSTAFDRAVAELERNDDLRPQTPAALVGLVAATRSSTARLCEIDGRPGLELVSLGTTRAKALDMPLLASVDGRAWSLRELTAAADHGLLYGTIPEVAADLDGLDPARVLALSSHEERLLVELFGDATYVRVDARDVLAQHEGVLVRDIAVGLRKYPSFPLLVEGVDPSGWSQPRRAACLDALLAQLILRFVGVEPPRPSEAEAYGDWEECRRQACRHLQWAVVHLKDTAPDELTNLALFRDADGHPRTWPQVAAALGTQLPLLYGQGLGEHELGRLTAAALDAETDIIQEPPQMLTAPPFVYRLLHEHGGRPAFEYAPPPGATGVGRDALLAAVDINQAELRGHIGVASTAMQPDVIVVLPDGRRTRAWELARKYGICGLVRVSSETWSTAVHRLLLASLDEAGLNVLRQLQDRLHHIDPHVPEFRRIRMVLLDYAAKHLALTALPGKGIASSAASFLSGQILGLPLFASRFGGPVPAWRLVRRFCAVASVDGDPTAVVLGDLAADLDPDLRDWVTSTLCLARVTRSPARPARAPAPLPVTSPDVLAHVALAHDLQRTMERLRPDRSEPVTVYVQYRGKDSWITGGVQQIVLNADHWIVSWALDDRSDEQAFVWLLLATYAFINEVREPVTNEHERAFQRSVTDALAAGTLRV